MRLTAVLLTTLLATAASALAQRLPEPEQFVDTSVVIFPTSLEAYGLQGTEYRPEQWTHGVTSHWTIGTAPAGLRFTVYVYPIGDSPEADVVSHELAGVAQSVQATTEQGVYSDLVVGEITPFVVVRPGRSLPNDDAAAGDTAPQPDVEPVTSDAATGTASAFEAALTAAMPGPNNHGLRQGFRFTHDGVPMRSLGYTFYRQLFAVKVRASTAVDSMDDTTFEALADTATRKLLPHIRVENYGRCGQIMLSPPTEDDLEAAKRAATLQLVQGHARLRAQNCTMHEGAAAADPPQGETRVRIVYPPNAWGGD